jgi:D-glycero-D-manno-heptose 1,7-bisphosphate phosphatase
MSATIEAGGARIDGWYYCPHYPTAVIEALRRNCECRKPKPGMIRQAAVDFPVDLARSYVVGDKIADVGLAQAVGATAVLVRTGYGETEVRRHGGAVPGAACVAPTLAEAASWILMHAGFPKEQP